MARSNNTEVSHNLTLSNTDIDLDALGKMGLTLAKDSTWASIDDFIPTLLPELDKQLGGGIPMGRIVELYSAPNVGKTTLAYQITSVANSMNIPVIWLDIEGTANQDHLPEVGVDINKTIIWNPDKWAKENKKDEATATSIENIGQRMEDFIHYFNSIKLPIVLVWDSIGASSSKSTLEGDFDNQQPGREAKAITQVINKIQPLIASSKASLIVINQIRDKMNAMAFGKKTDTPGGKALKHQASVRIELQKLKALTDINNADVKFGHHVRFSLEKSKISVPGSKTEAELYGTYGINQYINLIDTAVTYKIIKERSAGSRGKVLNIVDDEGEIHEISRKDLINEVIEDPEEWIDLLRPSFQRLIVTLFPEGYPAWDNKSLSVHDVPLLKDLDVAYETYEIMKKQEEEAELAKIEAEKAKETEKARKQAEKEAKAKAEAEARAQKAKDKAEKLANASKEEK